MLTVAYVGSQGRNEFQRTIGNLITGVTTNPTTGAANIIRQFGNQFGEFDVKTTFGSNHYNALQVGLNHRFAKGLTGSLSYTWSHNIGTSGGSNEATTSENNYSSASQVGNVGSDMRHVLNGRPSTSCPLAGAKNEFRWKPARGCNSRRLGLGGSLSFHTGLPINVLMQRNNVIYYKSEHRKLHHESGCVRGPCGNSGGHECSRRRTIPGTVSRPDVVACVDLVPHFKWMSAEPSGFLRAEPGAARELGYDARGRGPASCNWTPASLRDSRSPSASTWSCAARFTIS